MGGNPAKFLTAAIGMAVLASGQAADAPDFKSTFNMAALSEGYAFSCSARERVRRYHVRVPSDPATPADFKLDDIEFVRISTQLSLSQHNIAATAFDNLSPHIKDIAYMHGLVYVVPRVVAEAIPSLGNDEGYYNDLGLYMMGDRRAYIPMTWAETSRDKNGKIVADFYNSSSRDRHRMITHESGHAIDDIIGRLSLDGNAEHRLTARADFLAAFDADLDALVAIPGVSRDPNITRRNYYLPIRHNGVAIGGTRDSEQRNRREVFAELWAEINSVSRHQLSQIYPRTYAFVKNINDMVQDLHDNAPVQCTYSMNGQATPIAMPQ